MICQNGNPISCDGNEVPVSLRAGAVRMSDACNGNIRYSELFQRLQDVINNSKSAEKVSFVFEVN